MSSGTAAIHGLARSLDKYSILIDTGTIDLVGEGTHRMSRNLMIDQSASAVAKSYDSVFAIVNEYFSSIRSE